MTIFRAGPLNLRRFFFFDHLPSLLDFWNFPLVHQRKVGKCGEVFCNLPDGLTYGPRDKAFFVHTPAAPQSNIVCLLIVWDGGYDIPGRYASRVCMGMGTGTDFGTRPKPIPVSTRDPHVYIMGNT